MSIQTLYKTCNSFKLISQLHFLSHIFPFALKTDLMGLLTYFTATTWNISKHFVHS